MDIVMKKNARGVERPQDSSFNPRSVVRVLPTSDAIRKYIKHPLSRRGFLAEGSVEWPFDQFTKRRIADGDVVVVSRDVKVVEQKRLQLIEAENKAAKARAKPEAATESR